MCLQCEYIPRAAMSAARSIAPLDMVALRHAARLPDPVDGLYYDLPARTRGVVIERNGSHLIVIFRPSAGAHVRAQVVAADVIRMGPTIGPSPVDRRGL